MSTSTLELNPTPFRPLQEVVIDIPNEKDKRTAKYAFRIQNGDFSMSKEGDTLVLDFEIENGELSGTFKKGKTMNFSIENGKARKVEVQKKEDEDEEDEGGRLISKKARAAFFMGALIPTVASSFAGFSVLAGQCAKTAGTIGKTSLRETSLLKKICIVTLAAGIGYTIDIFSPVPLGFFTTSCIVGLGVFEREIKNLILKK